jgi:hypothetical protein
MPFFILRGVSGSPVLSGPIGHTPWNDIATLYSNQSEADAIHMHLLVRLSPQLHSLIKSDYYTIYMKHYAWIPTKRKAPNLYMFCVGSVNHSLLVTHAKYKQIRTTCLLAPDDAKSCSRQYEAKFSLV